MLSFLPGKGRERKNAPCLCLFAALSLRSCLSLVLTQVPRGETKDRERDIVREKREIERENKTATQRGKESKKARQREIDGEKESQRERKRKKEIEKEEKRN
jgi:hypothetical protein